MRGEVVYFRLFDLGGSIDLDEIRRQAPRDFLSGRVPTDRAAPKYAQFPEPLVVTVDRRTLETNLGPITFDLTVRLYAVGSLAITLRAPFDVPRLRDLMPFAGVRIRTESGEETLEGYCGRIARRIQEDLVPYLHDTYEVTTTPEPYLAYCITEPDVPARTFVEARRREVTALLASTSVRAGTSGSVMQYSR